MKQIPTTAVAVLLASLFIVFQTGCRSRCNQPCGGGFFATNTTVAPAPTYSMNIPSVAQNQPYYAPNGGPISTTARAPIPATGSSTSNSNSNLQWRQQGGTPTNSGSTFGVQPTQPSSGTRLVEVNNGINNGSSVLVSGIQNNATQPLPATGTSFTDSRNFATTQIDERLDATRVAATDATQVRATAQNFISARQQVAVNQPQPSQTFAASPAAQQVQPVYSTTGVIAANQPYYTNNPNLPQRQSIYAGQAYVQPNTAAYSASASNSIGWRNREIGSR